MIDKQKVENGVVIGNYYDKYHTKNPIAKYMMNGFLTSFQELLNKIEVTTAHEIGCGEGHLTHYILEKGIYTQGTDISLGVINQAKTNLAKYDNVKTLSVVDMYDLDEQDAAELIVCCEVMEHLTDPIKALEKLQTLSQKYCILSVPREPIWRVLNCMRGKYLNDFGNTPGHYQHWSKSSFVSLVEKYFEVIEIKTPLPWTMLLAKKR